MCLSRRQQASMAIQGHVYTTTVELWGHGIAIQADVANASRFYYPVGNLLEYTAGFDVSTLKRIAYKISLALYVAHDDGKVHGNFGPGMVYVDAVSVKLLDVEIGPLMHNNVNRIYWSSSHEYKARAELSDDDMRPSQLTDLHSFGKTIIALFTRRPFTASRNRVIPAVIGKPHEVPDDVWNIIVQVLDENLNINVNIGQIVSQLAAIV